MTQIKNQKKSFLNLRLLSHVGSKWWMIYDILVFLFALKVISWCYPGYASYQFSFAEYFCFPVFFLMSASIAGLYERNIFNDLVKLLLSLFVSIILAISGLVLLKNIFLYEQIGRYVLFFIFVITAIGCGLLRFFWGSYVKYFALRVLFVGNKRQAEVFKKYFNSSIGYYNFIGFCNSGVKSKDLKLGSINDIDQICNKQQVDIVVVDDSYIIKPHIFDKCLKVLKLDCVVIDKETFIEQNFEQVVVDEIDPSWFYRSNLGFPNNFRMILKRFIDIFCAIVGLVFTILIFPFVWLIIKLDSPGPVLYSQVRSGRFDKEFKIYKFRTMQVNAEKGGAVWASSGDVRVTKVGSILRKTRLDELPQFWNILIGDMSIVGPRPERPELVKKIEHEVPYFYFRNLVKPGITGFAQIKYRYGASVGDAKEKLKYDLYYVKNWSVFMDIQIILRTIVLMMKGSR